MLTENEIRVLIVKRMMAMCGSCNSFHINHVDGQIRGLLAVLLDGKKISIGDDVRPILDLAGIPYIDESDDEWSVPDEWLIANGCTVEGDIIRHPRLMEW